MASLNNAPEQANLAFSGWTITRVRRVIVVALREGQQLSTNMTELNDHQLFALWSAACAERVLHLFEAAAPGDERPGKAIEAARAWARGDLKMTDARKMAFASHAAARETNVESACLAARAAGHAAATAHVAKHSPHAAAYAIKAIAAQCSESKHEKLLDVEREWQLLQLPEHLRQSLESA